MGIIRSEIPILEYDTDPAALIEPNREKHAPFPKKAVFPFLADAAETYARRVGGEQIDAFVSATKVYPIFRIRYRGQEICLCQAPVGAPAAVQLLEYLIGYGAEKIISAGSCGALEPLPENAFLIPTEALRCEGTSYHYLPPARTVRANPEAVRALETALRENGLPYALCKTWTTDGFYRETKAMTASRRAEGCAVVEMECAALMACAEFRHAVFGQLLFTADTLAAPEGHDDRSWGLDSFPLALRLCLDAAAAL